MNRAAASAIARALGGSSSLLSPEHQTFAVQLTRADGRKLYLEEDAGACHLEDFEFVVGFRDVGDAYRHTVEGYEWPAWGTEAWASGLATLLGGQAHRRGNGWTVAFQRLDGRFVVIGDRWAEVYSDRAAYERLVGETERFEWA